MISSGDQKFNPTKKIEVTIIVTNDAIIKLVLIKHLAFLILGKNLIKEKFNPNIQRTDNKFIEETIVDAKPTSEEEYRRVATIQKTKPNPEVINIDAIRNREFFKRESCNIPTMRQI